MDRKKSLDRLHFEDEHAFDQEIYPICRLDPMPFEDDWHFHLPLHAKIPARQLERETFIVGRFEKSRTKPLMDANRRSDRG